MRITLPKRRTLPETTLEWRPPAWSNALERDRARVYFVAYAAGMAVYFVEEAMGRMRDGDTKVFQDFDVPGRGHRLRLPRGGARRRCRTTW